MTGPTRVTKWMSPWIRHALLCLEGCFVLWGDVCDPRIPNFALSCLFCFLIHSTKLLRAYFALDTELDVEEPRLIIWNCITEHRLWGPTKPQFCLFSAGFRYVASPVWALILSSMKLGQNYFLGGCAVLPCVWHILDAPRMAAIVTTITITPPFPICEIISE